MFAELREHEVRSNSGVSSWWIERPKHEDAARQGGVRMFAELREHKVRSNSGVSWSVRAACGRNADFATPVSKGAVVVLLFTGKLHVVVVFVRELWEPE